MAFKKKIVGGVVAASMLVAIVPAATALAADDQAAPASLIPCGYVFGNKCYANFWNGTTSLGHVGFYRVPGAAKDWSKEAPAVDGMEFVGWFDENGTQYIPGVTALTPGLNLYAKYQPIEQVITYTVIFRVDVDDESGASDIKATGESTASFADVWGEANAAAAAKADADGKKFVGWYYYGSDTLINANDPIADGVTVNAKYEDAETPSEDDKTENVVSFYDADQNLIQTVGYYAKDKVAFSTYAAGVQAPAVEGKVFAGWAFASNDGDVAVDVDSVVTGNWAVYATYKDAPAEDDDTQNVVSFYDADQNLIQTVGYYAKDKVAFSTYAAGVQAPAVEGKVFAGWGFASNEGDVPVDVNAVVTGDWAVYAMYKDAPDKEDPKTDDDTKKDETKADTKDEQKASKKASKKLSSTGAAVASVAVMAVIALAGGAAVLTMRKRA